MASKSKVMSGGSQTALRSANQQRVIDELSRRGTLTQADIARSTGLAASTVSNIVSDLCRQGIVERKTGVAGPHGQLLSLVPSAGNALGIEVGRRHLTFALADLAHNVIATKRIAFTRVGGWNQEMEAISAQIDLFLAEHSIKRETILVTGLALPAPLDLAGRRISATDVMPEWANIDIVDKASGILGMPVVADNDANLGAVGEHTWGAARGTDDLVYLKLADGIGAGLVLDGRLYRGADGSAGEVGHTTIDESGQMCQCGNRGCLETVAAVPAILKLMRPVMGKDVTVHDVIDGAKNGNAACIRILEDTGRVAGIALANLANIVNPRIVVVGGVLSEAGSILIDPLSTALSRYAVQGVAAELQFRPAELGLYSHVLGAVDLALSHAPAVFVGAGSEGAEAEKKGEGAGGED
ncbi:MAG: ROK family transcriptional regulator [Actinomycetaceae bacterium]|nr:ROK family transcriptional regulator [Actinomycetaceae bacterium]